MKSDKKNKTSKSLTTLLNEFDSLIKIWAPEDEGYDFLNKGASDKKLLKLQNFLVQNRLPQDLIEWFKWHDGQDGDDELYYDENGAMAFLSIDESISEMKIILKDIKTICNDPHKKDRKDYPNMPSWKSFWVPIMTSGACEYIVYHFTLGTLTYYSYDGTVKQVAKSLYDWCDEQVFKLKNETCES